MKFFIGKLVDFLLWIHSKSYALAGFFGSLLEKDRLHPKHRLMNYHKWFADKLQPEWKILDAGCGNGALSFDLKLKCREVVGIDINPEYINEAKNRFQADGIKYINADILEFPLDQDFDAIVLSNLLEHIEDRARFLKSLAKSQTKSPLILIRVPFFERDWITLYKKERGLGWKLDSTHYTEYTLEQFENELFQAGLKIRSYEIKFGEIYCVAKKV